MYARLGKSWILRPCKSDEPLHEFRDSRKSIVVLNVFALEQTWTRPKEILVDSHLSSSKHNFKGHRFPLLTIRVNVERYAWQLGSGSGWQSEPEVSSVKHCGPVGKHSGDELVVLQPRPRGEEG